MRTLNRKSIWVIISGIIGAIGTEIGIDAIIDNLSRYDREGYDADGYDREGYNRRGFNRAGFNRQGYNSEGYDVDGFNRQGYNSDNYDRQGFDFDGFNHDGRDKHGYDRNGYDIDGFDRFGRDAEGYNRKGYDIDGYNRNGYDWRGFGRDKYNDSGTDRAGHNRNYYSEQIKHLRNRLDEGYKQLQSGEYRYAVYDSRVVMEEALRLIVEHSEGEDMLGDKMFVNLKICEHKHLLGNDSDFIDRLHRVRHICNANEHKLNAEDSMTHNKVHFVIMQIRDLLDSAEDALVTV